MDENIASVVATPRKSFWKRPWGIVLIVLGVLTGIVLVFFGIMVMTFYRRIMRGEDLSYLARQGQFTQSVALAKEASAGAAAESVDVVTDDDPAIGNTDAPLVVVEFLDYECPFSSQAFPIIREAATKYPDKIRLIIRDLPLDDLHPNARIAAEAAECANEQKRFWSYHDKLFQNQQALDKENLILYAEQTGLDKEAFVRCLESGRFRAEVQEDFQAGVAAGAVGTPTFFINGRKFQGVIPEEVWEQLVTLVDVSSN
ncbi:MAG: thioredoxin domain-containing protein [Patescibacteria group bacterium]